VFPVSTATLVSPADTSRRAVLTHSLYRWSSHHWVRARGILDDFPHRCPRDHPPSTSIHPSPRLELVLHPWSHYRLLGQLWLQLLDWLLVMGKSYRYHVLSSIDQQRIPYIIQLPMAIYILVAVQFVPETPRFLMGKGRFEEAFEFLVEYHGNGDRTDKLVLFEFDEMKNAISKEREAKAEQWSVILRSPNNRKRLGLASLMIFMTNLSGSSIIYWYYTIIYSQVGITDPTTQTGIQAGLNVLTWFSQIAAVALGRKVGRKTILLWVWPLILACLVGLCASR
jgi:SP family sugar:H+ symporter-like MFS transporter